MSATTPTRRSEAQLAQLQAERRRHMVAFHIWSRLRKGDSLPDAATVLSDPECDFAETSIIIRINPDFTADVIAIGPNLPMPVAALPVPVAEIPGRSLVSRITEHCFEPLANRAPVGFEAEFEDESGAQICYRAIALPCASNGTVIDTVLGVMSFKIEAQALGPSIGSPLHQRRAKPAKTEPPAPGKAKPFGRKSAKGQKLTKTTENDRIETILDIYTGVDRDERRKEIMNFKEKLKEAIAIDGAIAVALFDLESGMPIATEQSGAKALDLEVAAAGNTNVLRAKYATMKELGIDETIEDVLITLETQIHMIRPATSESGKGLIIYLALDKSKANLALARMKLRQIEKGLEI